MLLIAVCAVVAIGVLIFARRNYKRSQEKRELEKYSIDPETLYELLGSKPDLLLVDIRQPLDLLAHLEMIPGAKRITPKEVITNPSLIPKEVDTVFYCTCISDKTSLDIVRRALALQFHRVKVLKGGLVGWKAKGYSVVPYVGSFHLDTAS